MFPLYLVCSDGPNHEGKPVGESGRWMQLAFRRRPPVPQAAYRQLYGICSDPDAPAASKVLVCLWAKALSYADQLFKIKSALPRSPLVVLDTKRFPCSAGQRPCLKELSPLYPSR